MANNILSLFTKAFAPRSSIASNRGNWFPIIKEPYSGAWQENQEQTREDMLAYPAVFACITLIANDISKLPLKLKRKDENDIWQSYDNPAYNPVLRKPNRYQTRIQFYESWVLSTLTYGNAYILKGRDARNVVTDLYVLDPSTVQVLVGTDGSIWYELTPDALSSLKEQVTVPASEIIHDRIHTLYHPLIGISPLYAAGLPILQGRNAQESSSHFFKNRGQPGGILTAPGAVSDETVEQLREYWAANYTGNNAGKVAVLADGLTYKSFDTVNAQASQLIEQLQWTAEVVCSVFHVPPYKIGAGNTPTSGNIESENIRYFAEALQKLIEGMEVLIDEGLAMPKDVGVEFDVNNLWRMDSKTMMESQEVGVTSGIVAPNEARKTLNLSPVSGGESPMAQQQNYSLAALAKRDAKEDPFDTGSSKTAASNDNQEDEETDKFITEFRMKAAERFIYAK